MADTKTLKSPADKAAPKASANDALKAAKAPRAAVPVAGVTRLNARPKKDVKNGPTMTEAEAVQAAQANAKNLAEQNAAAAAERAADRGSSAPSDHAPGYEAPRLDGEGNPLEAPAEHSDVPEAATIEPDKDQE